jgi:hypothetical protein
MKWGVLYRYANVGSGKTDLQYSALEEKMKPTSIE